MSDDLIKALQKEAEEDAEIITFLRAANEKLNVALDVCRKEANKAADEITRLRAELAAVTAERDRLREALKPFAAQLDHPGTIYEHDGVRMALVNQDILDRLCRRARAALEGVTGPKT